MSTASHPRLMTAEEYMKADLEEGRYELVRGEVVEVSPPISDHAYVCMQVGFLLHGFGRQTGYGYCLASDASVQTERDPDTVRGPDVCFYSEARHPRTKNMTEPGVLTIAPDVAIEVVSPSNRRGELLRKVSEYLTAGSLAVWLVYPRKRSIAIFRDPQTPPIVLKDGDVIEDQPELPGFSCPVTEVFDG